MSVNLYYLGSFCRVETTIARDQKPPLTGTMLTGDGPSRD